MAQRGVQNINTVLCELEVKENTESTPLLFNNNDCTGGPSNYFV